MTIGDRIKVMRKQKNMSLDIVGKHIGVSRQTVQKYEKNIITNLPSEKIEKLAQLFGTTPMYLMGWEDNNSKIDYLEYMHEQSLLTDFRSLNDPGQERASGYVNDLTHVPRYRKVQPAPPTEDCDDNEPIYIGQAEELTKADFREPDPERVRMKVYNQTAAAGLGDYLREDCDYDYALYAYKRDDIPRGADFGIRIDGDSMEPEIHDGDIVWVRHQPRLESDEIGIFTIGDLSYCKKLHIIYDSHSRANRVELVSLNENYGPIIIEEYEEFRAIGKVLL